MLKQVRIKVFSQLNSLNYCKGNKQDIIDGIYLQKKKYNKCQLVLARDNLANFNSGSYKCNHKMFLSSINVNFQVNCLSLLQFHCTQAFSS